MGENFFYLNVAKAPCMVLFFQHSKYRCFFKVPLIDILPEIWTGKFSPVRFMTNCFFPPWLAKKGEATAEAILMIRDKNNRGRPYRIRLAVTGDYWKADAGPSKYGWYIGSPEALCHWGARNNNKDVHVGFCNHWCSIATFASLGLKQLKEEKTTVKKSDLMELLHLKREKNEEFVESTQSLENVNLEEDLILTTGKEAATPQCHQVIIQFRNSADHFFEKTIGEHFEGRQDRDESLLNTDHVKKCANKKDDCPWVHGYFEQYQKVDQYLDKRKKDRHFKKKYCPPEEEEEVEALDVKNISKRARVALKTSKQAAQSMAKSPKAK